MGKKGKKTRWRRLPIGGTDEESGLTLDAPTPSSDQHRHRVTFNEDEYTKITTPRQDVLFKKGYLGRKRTPPNPSPCETQEVHSGDSVETESYVSEEAQYAYPAPAGYLDPNGVYYVNGNTFETYDPYTGTVTVVVGPPAPYPGAPPVLAALPCQPVPLQPVEWFNPAAAAPWCYSYNRRKRYSTDSQNCSAQSSESTGPPGSPQEPVDEAAAAMYPPPGHHYVYPGYMFGPPIYNMNGMTVQGMMPQAAPMPQDMTTGVSKRRKKRRRRRRGGVTDDGSESSCCEEPMTCDMTGCQSETSQSGASSDAGVGPNSDSGINTNSGSNSPPLEHQQHQHLYSPLSGQSVDDCEAATPTLDAEVPVVEELSAADDDVTPNLCAAAPEFSSQESTLSCLSSPSAAKDLLLSEQEVPNDATEEEMLSSQPISLLQEVTVIEEIKDDVEVSPCLGNEENMIPLLIEPVPVSPIDDLTEQVEKSIRDYEEALCEMQTDSEPIMSSKTFEIEVFDNESELENPVEHVFVKPRSISGEEADSGSDGVPEVDEEVAQEVYIETTAQEKDLNIVTFNEQEYEEPIFEEESVKEFVISFVFQQAKFSTVDTETAQNEENCHERAVTEDGEKVKGVLGGINFNNTYETLDATIAVVNDSLMRLSSNCDSLAPVPPPRRKKSLCRAADKTATRVVEEAIKEGQEEAARVRLKNTLTLTEAVTRWLNSHESSPLTCPASEDESDSDEGIEVEEEELTGQKNVRGNPFPVSSHSDAGQRVANDFDSLSSAGEWDLWDHSHTRDMCDPARSVDKYYRLGGDEGVPSVYKTAMHIRHTGPFPCGVCCIIQ
ncbi:uncharacterized protein LOC128995868 isoform X2 [Macrosteles quadrilineatus]|uniref:uncharacterized protein LOC128995868 isoform X2 n=1 Tax=Macrosteles quadrilineatus TaxID=74068 RepID=UPI0023E20A0E|nr:uncharacterized protein LOC128995868 isoform X2 [Macrosteles quadrilineatus]